MSDPPLLQTTIRPPLPVDLDLTLRPLRCGAFDPTMRKGADGAWWRATRTPLGPATARYAPARGGAIRVQAWGPGAEWAIDAAPDLVGANDSLEGFEPRGKLLVLHHAYAGLRIARSRAVYEATVVAIVEQMVSGKEAWRTFRALVRALGEPAPGPAELVLPLAPRALGRATWYALRAFGLERRRATTLSLAARRAARLDEAAAMEPRAARARLEAIPGIGPWTAARVALVALGDADAVTVGDYNLPHAVTYAFTGELRGDDARMLELLAPYAGHRGRVVRLIEAAGIAPPRFAPRYRLRPRGA